ncbi:glycosyltransferase [Flavobacterium granuli]|uniref:Glycosyl transferase family 2 n=1 Tax=Flavobacterium granuli TaxID=280093 RepID=A0A1M5QMA2_9FLAO|nr:glycosyltransferase [Flavobacterium granuli]PRZ20074.1 glycosyl transferase family 2 [Flavobacterium granuli]SHH14703.1 Glycosyl transferase family 2 [Flavobacterium granuli]
MNKISVVIRNKNQAEALEFLLKNLTERYHEDIDEIIVIDNISNDNSEQVVNKYGAKLVQIKKFSYGVSANLAAESASNEIVVIFSSHAYPVSHDFFKLISKKFEENINLAGLRCLHNKNDFRNYINNISSRTDPNKSGLIFCGSAFSKKIWELHKFKDDIQTMEDKEWSLRVIKNGFDIDFSASIFCYDIVRDHKQIFFRFKNEVIGGYQLWHTQYSYKRAIKGLIGTIFKLFKTFLIELYFAFKRFFFLLRFLSNKPEKF